MCYPYPKSDEEIYKSAIGRDDEKDIEQIKKEKLQWHLKSGALNHRNFTNMVLFALSASDRNRDTKVLDYGGGGGQFALIVKSLFPLSNVYIVDISDAKLLDQYRPINHQIKFDDFMSDATRFDVIFMNDVFEHVSDPLGVLKTLRSKLVDINSRIFIDTPSQFWIYPITKVLNKKLYTKVLRGTVDHDHQQIWSNSSFAYVVKKADLCIVKYKKISEFTQQPEFYLDNMKITNPVIRLIGKFFYRIAPFIARNKIMAVLKPTTATMSER